MYLPRGWTSVRTILVFARAAKSDRPKPGHQFYFEIPAGITQIESFRTEVHLFLFDTLPSNARDALDRAANAEARYKCKTIGVDNKQGFREVKANWRVEPAPSFTFAALPSGTYRPPPPANMQQVRAEVLPADLPPFEYQFERKLGGWDPELSPNDVLPTSRTMALSSEPRQTRSGLIKLRDSSMELLQDWNLVKGLNPRLGAAKETDQLALRLAAPESGSFILIALGLRPKGRAEGPEEL